MTNLEMAELLRDKAGISLEEAKEALEQSNWDLLEAMLLLERQGKTEPGCKTYSTKAEWEDAPKRDPHLGATGGLRRLGDAITRLVRVGNENHFVVSRSEKELLSLPVTAFVLLLALAFWLSIIALIVGLFCGLHYSFRGPNLGKQSINDAMERAASMADSVREDLMREQRANEGEDKQA